MKKSILPFLIGGLSVFALGAAYPNSNPNPAQNQAVLRYQLRDTQDVVIIDTNTGEVWRHLNGWKSLGVPGE
jgi:hypothetical protein